MAAVTPNFISNLAMGYGVSTGSTLKPVPFRFGHHKAGASFSMIAASSQREKQSPSAIISCVSEAQKDGGKFRHGQGSTMALVFAAYMVLSKLERVVSPVIKVIKAYFADQVKCIPLHSIPVHIAVALAGALVVSLTLVTAGVFIGYLLAGSGNPGTGTSALLSIETITIDKVIWGGKRELPLPQDKASTAPVDAVNNYHELSREELLQMILRKFTE